MKPSYNCLVSPVNLPAHLFHGSGVRGQGLAGQPQNQNQNRCAPTMTCCSLGTLGSDCIGNAQVLFQVFGYSGTVSSFRL